MKKVFQNPPMGTYRRPTGFFRLQPIKTAFSFSKKILHRGAGSPTVPSLENKISPPPLTKVLVASLPSYDGVK